MNALDPTISQLCFERASGKFKPTLVEVCAQLVDAGHPDHHRRCICKKAEAFFSLAPGRFSLLQCFFDPSAFRDVVDHPDDHSPGIGLCRTEAHLNWKLIATLP